MLRLQDTASMKQSPPSAFVSGLRCWHLPALRWRRCRAPRPSALTEVELKDVINGVSAKRHVNPVGGGRLLQLAASGTAVIAQMGLMWRHPCQHCGRSLQSKLNQKPN
jgi:hypothetical protein